MLALLMTATCACAVETCALLGAVKRNTHEILGPSTHYNTSFLIHHH